MLNIIGQKEKERPARLSRHHSDLAPMATHNDFVDGKLEISLFKDVVAFKRIFFRSAWANYENAKCGSLRLFPSDELAAELRKGYADMRVMFFEEPPPFDEVLAILKQLESRLNGPGEVSQIQPPAQEQCWWPVSGGGGGGGSDSGDDDGGRADRRQCGTAT
jgi:hypothetical protein